VVTRTWHDSRATTRGPDRDAAGRGVL